MTVKSFLSREDAENFVAGKAVRPAADAPTKFYAVAVGSPTGIYNDWADASEAIKGVKGPKYKRFATEAEAVQYIKQFGNKEAIEALGELANKFGPPPVDPSQATGSKIVAPEEGVLNVYTDGSSRANGRIGARAGLGVFFGHGDPRNLSERLQGEPQTNQRAELMAIQRALEVVPLERDVQILTDSRYSIDCVTQWAERWEKNGWKTTTGDVKHKDIIAAVTERIRLRAKTGGKTYFKWVKGHASDAGNVAADLLAVKGAAMN